MTKTMLRVTDLRQWAYCPRIVYYQHFFGAGAGKATFKMEAGRAAQDVVEDLELRRTLTRYGMEGARRLFGVWLQDEELGLAGKLDLLLEREGEGAVVEFKLTAGEVGENHRMQLVGYALLAEAVKGWRTGRGFVYRIPDGRVFAVEIDAELRARVRRAITEMTVMIEAEEQPGPTPVRGRCEECEYANYCGDVW